MIEAEPVDAPLDESAMSKVEDGIGRVLGLEASEMRVKIGEGQPDENKAITWLRGRDLRLGWGRVLRDGGQERARLEERVEGWMAEDRELHPLVTGMELLEGVTVVGLVYQAHSAQEQMNIRKERASRCGLHPGVAIP